MPLILILITQPIYIPSVPLGTIHLWPRNKIMDQCTILRLQILLRISTILHSILPPPLPPDATKQKLTTCLKGPLSAASHYQLVKTTRSDIYPQYQLPINQTFLAHLHSTFTATMTFPDSISSLISILHWLTTTGWLQLRSQNVSRGDPIIIILLVNFQETFFIPGSSITRKIPKLMIQQ